MEQQQQTKNDYMAQVMLEQAQVDDVLNFAPKRAKRRALQADRLPGGPVGGGAASSSSGSPSEDSTPAVDVRITGWGRWRRVIVPPNAYVVHTTLGQQKPVHCGLGLSFAFNPYTDAFLVVPSAMQTIMISANCICRERQGILVQGYVQWIIDDFETAYRKLDFSDPVEPMKVVNVQLREQAEAAIKDTVVSMGIDDVLSDKQPIVQVLTARLRALAEGSAEREGLGLRIITVQIKEAVVSSSKLWESLQSAFRAERFKTARLASLVHEAEVHERETEARKTRDALEIATGEEVAAHRAEAEARAFDREQKEAVRRAALEAETLEVGTVQRKAKLEAEAQVDALRLEQELEQEARRAKARNKLAEDEIRLAAARRDVENNISSALVQQRLIDKLPEIAASLPKPDELKTISLGGLDGVRPLLTDLAALVHGAGAKVPSA